MVQHASHDRSRIEELRHTILHIIEQITCLEARKRQMEDVLEYFDVEEERGRQKAVMLKDQGYQQREC